MTRVFMGGAVPILAVATEIALSCLAGGWTATLLRTAEDIGDRPVVEAVAARMAEIENAPWSDR